MRVEKLTKEKLEEYIDRILELERHYSDVPSELWNKESFFIEMGGKFDLSKIILDNDQVIGYAIISIKQEPPIGYIHRVFINPKYKGGRGYLKLCEAIRKGFQELKIGTLKWKCAVNNQEVYKHYKRLSDRIIGEEIYQGQEYHIFEMDIKTKKD